MTDEFVDGDYGFETRAIHAAQAPDEATGAVVTPIHLATTFAQDEVGKHRGFEYARTSNPTRLTLERCLASLENASYGYAFASGLAAEDALLRTLVPGDHLLMGDDAYGGTFRLINRVHKPIGIEWSAVDLTDPSELERAWQPNTKLVWIETPTNPLLTIVDIPAVAAFARERGALVVVDNTFATPYLQQPLSLGADVVVHSSTKYLGGHSDVVGGFLATDRAALAEQIKFLQNATGAVPSPFDCYLLLRGIKTLAVRVERQCQSAQAIAEMLATHRAVCEVRYPGLTEDPGHAIAARQMRGFGAMVSFRLRAGREEALRVAASTKVFTLAESLGAVESLIEHPGAMTHASAAGSPLEVPDDLIRLSVGLETTDDLIRDLYTALSG